MTERGDCRGGGWKILEVLAKGKFRGAELAPSQRGTYVPSSEPTVSVVHFYQSGHLPPTFTRQAPTRAES